MAKNCGVGRPSFKNLDRCHFWGLSDTYPSFRLGGQRQAEILGVWSPIPARVVVFPKSPKWRFWSFWAKGSDGSGQNGQNFSKFFEKIFLKFFFFWEISVRRIFPRRSGKMILRIGKMGQNFKNFIKIFKILGPFSFIRKGPKFQN